MPWDEYGKYDLSEYASGYRCGFCNATGSCAHDYFRADDEQPEPAYPEQPDAEELSGRKIE